MTHSQRARIINLFSLGHPFSVITERTGVGRKAISRILAQAGINTSGKTYTVVSDPSELYTPGATFDQGNICASLWLNAWIPGMEFVERGSGEVYRVRTWICESRGREIERQELVNGMVRLRPANVHALRRYGR